MSKLRLLVVAMVACLTVGSVAVAAAKPKDKPKKIKVNTKVNLNYTNGSAPTTFDPYNPYTPYDPNGQNASFNGKVKAKKGCARRRSVTVSRLGQTSSDRDGQFSFAVNGAAAEPGNYRIRVKGKKFVRGKGKRERIIKCKPESKTLTIVSG